MMIPIRCVAVFLAAAILAWPGLANSDTISIVSFNIKWLGHYKSVKNTSDPEKAFRKNDHLAELLEPYDIVVVQEMVAPPVKGRWPGTNESFTADEEAAAFLAAMKDHGFQYVLSSEDTGRRRAIHTNTPQTEWFVAFYKPDRVCASGTPSVKNLCDASDLPFEFLGSPRGAHPVFDRVPHVFGFRVPGGPDFALISVHLAAASTSAGAAKRTKEIRAIVNWIEGRMSVEKDYLIIGDMNFANCKELEEVLPVGYVALNDECRDTTIAKSHRPFDQVLYRKETTDREIDKDFDLQVINLIDEMRERWDEEVAYPGEPLKNRKFEIYYSDHHPIVFRIKSVADDDS